MKKLLFVALFLSSVCYAENSTNSCFSEITEKRHSGYAINPDRQVSTEDMHKMAKAASLAPSSYNEQPWRFIFCDRVRTPESYEKALNSLVEANQKWAKNAPTLIVVYANTRSNHTDKGNSLAEYDTGAAAVTLCYAATTLGLMTHQMGGFDSKKISNSFGLKADTKPMAVIAVGYEVENSQIEPKKRLPLNDLFYLGKPGTALQ